MAKTVETKPSGISWPQELQARLDTMYMINRAQGTRLCFTHMHNNNVSQGSKNLHAAIYVRVDPTPPGWDIWTRPRSVCCRASQHRAHRGVSGRNNKPALKDNGQMSSKFNHFHCRCRPHPNSPTEGSTVVKGPYHGVKGAWKGLTVSERLCTLA